jgi:hypothetical protein
MMGQYSSRSPLLSGCAGERWRRGQTMEHHLDSSCEAWGLGLIGLCLALSWSLYSSRVVPEYQFARLPPELHGYRSFSA